MVALSSPLKIISGVENLLLKAQNIFSECLQFALSPSSNPFLTVKELPTLSESQLAFNIGRLSGQETQTLCSILIYYGLPVVSSKDYSAPDESPCKIFSLMTSHHMLKTRLLQSAKGYAQHPQTAVDVVCSEAAALLEDAIVSFEGISWGAFETLNRLRSHRRVTKGQEATKWLENRYEIHQQLWLQQLSSDEPTYPLSKLETQSTSPYDSSRNPAIVSLLLVRSDRKRSLLPLAIRLKLNDDVIIYYSDFQIDVVEDEQSVLRSTILKLCNYWAQDAVLILDVLHLFMKAGQDLRQNQAIFAHLFSEPNDACHDKPTVTSAVAPSTALDDTEVAVNVNGAISDLMEWYQNVTAGDVERLFEETTTDGNEKANTDAYEALFPDYASVTIAESCVFSVVLTYDDRNLPLFRGQRVAASKVRLHQLVSRHLRDCIPLSLQPRSSFDLLSFLPQGCADIMDEVDVHAQYLLAGNWFWHLCLPASSPTDDTPDHHFHRIVYCMGPSSISLVVLDAAALASLRVWILFYKQIGFDIFEECRPDKHRQLHIPPSWLQDARVPHQLATLRPGDLLVLPREMSYYLVAEHGSSLLLHWHLAPITSLTQWQRCFPLYHPRTSRPSALSSSNTFGRAMQAYRALWIENIARQLLFSMPSSSMPKTLTPLSGRSKFSSKHQNVSLPTQKRSCVSGLHWPLPPHLDYRYDPYRRKVTDDNAASMVVARPRAFHGDILTFLLTPHASTLSLTPVSPHHMHDDTGQSNSSALYPHATAQFAEAHARFLTQQRSQQEKHRQQTQSQRIVTSVQLGARIFEHLLVAWYAELKWQQCLQRCILRTHTPVLDATTQSSDKSHHGDKANAVGRSISDNQPKQDCPSECNRVYDHVRIVTCAGVYTGCHTSAVVLQCCLESDDLVVEEVVLQAHFHCIACSLRLCTLCILTLAKENPHHAHRHRRASTAEAVPGMLTGLLPSGCCTDCSLLLSRGLSTDQGNILDDIYSSSSSSSESTCSSSSSSSVSSDHMKPLSPPTSHLHHDHEALWQSPLPWFVTKVASLLLPREGSQSPRRMAGSMNSSGGSTAHISPWPPVICLDDETDPRHLVGTARARIRRWLVAQGSSGDRWRMLSSGGEAGSKDPRHVMKLSSADCWTALHQRFLACYEDHLDAIVHNQQPARNPSTGRQHRQHHKHQDHQASKRPRWDTLSSLRQKSDCLLSSLAQGLQDELQAIQEHVQHEFAQFV